MPAFLLGVREGLLEEFGTRTGSARSVQLDSSASKQKEWESTDAEVSQDTFIVEDAVLAQCLLETLRLSTTVLQIINKRTMQDTEFEGFTIPKGWVLGGPLLPRENLISPEVFDPSRFNQNPDLYSFIAFGRGPRMCSGEEFGMAVMQPFLYHLVQNSDWELVDPEEEFTMFFAPRPKHSLQTELKTSLQVRPQPRLYPQTGTAGAQTVQYQGLL
ncbi:hypothetical protein Mp_8g07210 [Marchantia polymorpha subsp. ruderalis]|uniref:Cytochrome P450 n=1 Tax=Marchantia polymorpha TaxID=3197 RepID=A0A2R6XIB3_MARPO|nr:hypothetical protein MARPO_0013s0071 [Marchantia polymorpha]BBN19003.1 hypothetical protein Mp_8g07210 [Marchantia polymorpha subsp. ruderalis]|eukprot:PTQ45843.1 hypothetical protein MARPO_0013s0071 [Marchantia polymorpha]